VRERALIHIGGPPGAGKTTFIETAIANAGERVIIAARCRRDDSLSQPRESLPKTDPELRRYRAAGACGEALYSFPAGGDAHDAFFMTSFMENYSNGVFLEGDNPVGFVEIAVYVAPASGGRLLVRGKRDRTGEEQAGVDALEAMLRQPGGLDLLLERLLGDRMAEVGLRDSELVERERVKMLTELDRLRSTPEPRSTMRWAIADEYRGIERAQLVVVNIRGEAEREQGEMLLAEVARLRKDQAVFDDVMGRRGSKLPITAVVANLTEPKDLGTKKALARVRRVVRPVV
jgi:RecA/RadA recombinase